MASSRTLSIRYVGDPKGALGAVRSIESAHASLASKLRLAGGALSSVGTKLTRSLTLPIVGAGVAAVKLASDAEETRNRVDVVFGDMADQVLSWSKTTIESMGAASATSQDVAATFGLLFKSAGLVGKGLTDMSIDFAQLAGDASSFFNVPIQEALDRIRSGLTGEAEPMRKFGVFLNEAAVAAEAARLGIAKVGEELTDQEKIMARASLITKGMSDAQGDFERTSESAANQIRQTVERLKEMGAEIGADLIPVAQDLLAVVQDWIEKFRELTPEQRQQVIKWAAIAAAAGPVLRIFGGLLNISGAVIGFFTKVATEATAAGTAAQGAATKTRVAWGRVAGSLIFAELTAAIAVNIAEHQKWEAAAKSFADQVRAGKRTLGELAGAIDVIEAKAPAIGTMGDPVGHLQEQYFKLKTEVFEFATQVAFLPGAMNPVRLEMVKNKLAAGDYAGAMEFLRRLQQLWMEDLREAQKGLKELTTEFDRNAETTRTWRQNQREATAGTREAAEANARLGADVRRLGDYIDGLPKQHKTNIEANTEPARRTIEAFIRQITQRTYTLTFTAQREGGFTGAQHGFHGLVRGPHTFFVEPGQTERVDITPSGATGPRATPVAGSLAGLEIVGVLDTPFGPAEIRGMVISELARRDRATARVLRSRRAI